MVSDVDYRWRMQATFTGDEAGLKLSQAAVNDESDRKKLVSTLRSLSLMLFIFLPSWLAMLILHEGGHTLADIADGATLSSITHLYVHPFDFNGYVRPIQFWGNVWGHAAGHLVSLTVTLSIFVFFWRRRSVSTLPLLMLFPVTAIMSGMSGVTNMLLGNGDYYNIVRITGLPPALFYVFGFLLFAVGIFFWISLMPLYGLAPGDLRSLIVIPGMLLIWKALSIAVANYFVPGSSIDVLYGLGDEIIMSANSTPLFEVGIGLAIAVIYIIIGRGMHNRLPNMLRSEKSSLAWDSIRMPFLLCVISVIVGLIAIR